MVTSVLFNIATELIAMKIAALNAKQATIYTTPTVTNVLLTVMNAQVHHNAVNARKENMGVSVNIHAEAHVLTVSVRLSVFLAYRGDMDPRATYIALLAVKI